MHIYSKLSVREKSCYCLLINWDAVVISAPAYFNSVMHKFIVFFPPPSRCTFVVPSMITDRIGIYRLSSLTITYCNLKNTCLKTVQTIATSATQRFDVIQVLMLFSFLFSVTCVISARATNTGVWQVIVSRSRRKKAEGWNERVRAKRCDAVDWALPKRQLFTLKNRTLHF